MKLQDKKKILADSNIQKKAQIDEGVLIAKKVDKLREELVNLEKQHKDFIAGTKLELHKETSHLIDRIEILKGEVRRLENNLVELRKPLDDEWAAAAEARVLFSKEIEAFAVKEAQYEVKDQALTKKEIELANREAQIAETEKSLQQLSESTNQLHEEIAQIAAAARQEKTAHDKAIAEANAQVAKEQEQNRIDAADNKRDKEILDEREKKLDDKERAIDDKYQTLLRTIERLK